MWVWGTGVGLGLGGGITEQNRPKMLPDVEAVVQLACGAQHTVALTATGQASDCRNSLLLQYFLLSHPPSAVYNRICETEFRPKQANMLIVPFILFYRHGRRGITA